MKINKHGILIDRLEEIIFDPQLSDKEKLHKVKEWYESIHNFKALKKILKTFL